MTEAHFVFEIRKCQLSRKVLSSAHKPHAQNRAMTGVLDTVQDQIFRCKQGALGTAVMVCLSLVSNSPKEL